MVYLPYVVRKQRKGIRIHTHRHSHAHATGAHVQVGAQCSRGGGPVHAPKARGSCTTDGLELNTTHTKVVVPTTCACIPNRRSLMAPAVATRTVRSFTVWSTRTQARWTRTTTRMPRAPCASTKRPRRYTCSGAARPAAATTIQCTMA